MATGWGKPEERRLVGKRLPRLGAVAQVTGQAKYTHDIKLPGMLYGRVLRSPHPHAIVKSIDTGKAERLTGVKAVIKFAGRRNETTEVKKVLYVGHHVAAVAATSPEIAEEALDLIRVDYQLLPFVVEADQAIQPQAPKVFPDGNLGAPRVREEGDLAAGFAQAAVVVEGNFRTPVLTHTCLETHSAVARWEGDQLTLWSSTQGIFSVRDGVAGYFGIPHHKVRVITDYMGGGFGSKLWAWPHDIIAAELAREAGAPVRLALTREEEHLCTGNRPDSFQYVKAGATREGKLIAFQHKNFGTGGISGGAGVPMPFIYQVPNFRTEQNDVHTHGGPGAPMRAPGHPQAAFVMETIMDELAEKLGMDPLLFRKKNDPNPVRQKQYPIGAREIGWERRNSRPGAGKGPKKRGIGMGSCRWGTRGRGTKAQLVIYPDGIVEVRCGTQDIGTGTRTLVAMVAAEELGLALEQVRVRIGDTEWPPSGSSGGSTTAPSVCPAIKVTADRARDKLFALVAPIFGVAPGALRVQDGKIVRQDDPKRSMTWQEATARIGAEPLVADGEWIEGLSGRGVAGVQFAEVEVDTETGQVRVVKVVAVQDCGLTINKLTAESQINSGVIMGLGFALYEQRVMDPSTGHMVNANMEDYKIPGTCEIPEIVPIVYEGPDDRLVKGLGEPPTIGTAGAVANAIYNAVGVRIRELPISPDKILMALAGQQKEG